MEGWDPNTKSTLTQIPLLTIKAGPRDGTMWMQRLKEEYKALIAYTGMNKSRDNDWFRISAANPEGTRWVGKCWYVHNLLKYEFDLQFDIPVTYPSTSPEIELPELDGKTHKMYRGGKICLTVHFKPLWAKNCPRFGIAHALCLGLAPWLAAEIPILVDSGMIKHKDDAASSGETYEQCGSNPRKNGWSCCIQEIGEENCLQLEESLLECSEACISGIGDIVSLFSPALLRPFSENHRLLNLTRDVMLLDIVIALLPAVMLGHNKPKFPLVKVKQVHQCETSTPM